MNAPTKLTAFALLLGATFATAWGAGAAWSPTVADTKDHGSRDKAPSAGHGEHRVDAPATPRGALRVATGTEQLPLAQELDYEFTVTDSSGAVIREFDEEGGVRMHLIVVRQDLTDYQHLHPTQRDDGTWTTPLTLSRAGQYTAFIDFERDGQRSSIPTRIAVPGAFIPDEAPAPTGVAQAGEYEVRLQERHGEIAFEIRRDGRVVEDLQQFIGAKAHLVALRHGTLRYIHVHPAHEGSTRPSFLAEFDEPGTYRLFLQFRHDDAVHTAVFDREASR